MAIPEGMKRRAVDVPIEHDEQMAAAQDTDGVPTTTRMRAMVAVWVSDASVRGQVDQVAAQMTADSVRRRRAGMAKARRGRWKESSDSD